nr:sensor histidine kinase [Anaerotalea alkaliphila]
MSKPLHKLAEAAGRISRGDLTAREVPVGSRDEIGALAAAFNTMGRNIQELVDRINENASIEIKLRDEEVKVARTSQLLQEAEFNALQARINPHFLFNTLNVIGRTAMFEDADKTSRLVIALADIYRYRLRQAGRDVALEEELGMLRQYLVLQKTRFDERLEFRLELGEEDLKRMRIPALLVQPLVENAIIHGVEPKVEGGIVRIKIFRRKGMVQIRVTDTGMGIPPEVMEGISRDKESPDGSRIGVQNVRQRVRLYYGENGGFQARSKRGCGTCMILRIPLEEAEDV